MKRTFILIAIAFLLVGGLAIADEAILIDFTLLSADISVNATDKDGKTLDSYIKERQGNFAAIVAKRYGAKTY